MNSSRARLERALNHLGAQDATRGVQKRARLSHIIRRQQGQSADHYAQLPDDLAAWHLEEPLPSASEQLDNLILLVGDTQLSPEQWATLSVQAASAWVGAALNPQSSSAGIGWVISQALPQELFDRGGGTSGKLALRLTLKGWERHAAVRRGKVESRLVLMAMQFVPEMDAVVTNCFAPAVARAGFELRTLATKQPAGLIDDQLRVALRRSRFIIADLTHGNKGAYWEGGFAEGLGRSVIYTCRAKEWGEGTSHFDTKHLVTIIWDPNDLDDAGKKLTATIRATLPDEAVMDDA